jgi:hypothetical protein
MWKRKPHNHTTSAASDAVFTPGPNRGRMAAWCHRVKNPSPTMSV